MPPAGTATAELDVAAPSSQAEADLLDTSNTSNPAIRYAVEQERAARARHQGRQQASRQEAATPEPEADPEAAPDPAPSDAGTSRRATADADSPSRTAPTARASSSRPRSEATPAADEATPADGATPAADESVPDGSDWRRMLDTADAKELRSHPRIAGIVGDLAKKQAEAEVKKLRAELEQQQTNQRLFEADDNDDLLTLGEAKRTELRTLRQQAATQQAEQEQLATEAQHARSTLERVQAQIHDYATTAMPKAVLDAAAKDVDFEAIPFEQGVRTWLEKVVDAAVAHKLGEAVERRLTAERKTIRAQVEKELRPALRQELLGEAAENEPSPDLDKGSAAPRRATFAERLNAANDIKDLNAIVDSLPPALVARMEQDKFQRGRVLTSGGARVA